MTDPNTPAPCPPGFVRLHVTHPTRELLVRHDQIFAFCEEGGNTGSSVRLGTYDGMLFVSDTPAEIAALIAQAAWQSDQDPFPNRDYLLRLIQKLTEDSAFSNELRDKRIAALEDDVKQLRVEVDELRKHSAYFDAAYHKAVIDELKQLREPAPSSGSADAAQRGEGEPK